MSCNGDGRSNLVMKAILRAFGHFVLHGQRTTSAVFGFVALSVAGACSGPASTLDPAGPHAEGAARLWWVMLAGAVLIFAGVMLAALYALKRRRIGYGLSESAMLWGGGLLFPAVTLTSLLCFALIEGEAMVPHAGQPALRVEAESRQFLWVFRYPDSPAAGSSTVLHMPTGRPVDVHVTSRDVIHSFWIPRLGGKIDAIPGRTNIIRLRADTPGAYMGVCAEFCGVGHAGMRFTVQAHTAEEYQSLMQSLAAKSGA